MIEGFGERLKAFLKARKITLAVCEQKTGISKKTLGSYINGSVNPSAMAIIRLAKGLDVSADWLLCLSNEIKRAPEKPKKCQSLGKSEAASNYENGYCFGKYDTAGA